MVKTRSGMVTKTRARSSGGAEKKEEAAATATTMDGDAGGAAETAMEEEGDGVYRYPKCRREGQHGMCAACAMAGFTKAGYIKYFNENPRRALPRPPVRRGAPPKLST
jgi:hypothetical protein